VGEEELVLGDTADEVAADLAPGAQPSGRATGSLPLSPTAAAETATVEISLAAGGRALVAAQREWTTAEAVETASVGDLEIRRRYLRRSPENSWMVVAADESVQVGELIRVELEVRSALALASVEVVDPRPAGFEPQQTTSGARWIDSHPVWVEVRDAGTTLLVEDLPAGVLLLDHTLVARVSGRFSALPARVEARLAPEIAGFSASGSVEIVGP
jgi:uncharacterized protein YfaS (alpha-2-macroglobulin family)